MKQHPLSTDIKYLNIPNICFSLTEETDNREPIYSEQRQLRGFDDSETWSLTDTICLFILPRLQRFKEINASTPAQLTEKEWNDILDKIIISLQLTCKEKGVIIQKKYNTTTKEINNSLSLADKKVLDHITQQVLKNNKEFINRLFL